VAVVVAAAALAVDWLAFTRVYRPWQLTWGATKEEVHRPMVGDGLVRNPAFVATRAVTIEATPHDIWPWIVQMGYGRAGFYSWDALDNHGVPSAERIIPQYQHLRVGDLIRMSKGSYALVAELSVGRHLLLVFDGARAEWAWELHPVGAHRTRLLKRLQVRPDNLVSRLALETFEILTTRRRLLGIKRRAECRARAPASERPAPDGTSRPERVSVCAQATPGTP
jgi:hypothetical protein